MFKRILIAIVFVVALAISAFFTWLNPGEISLDFGFAALESPLGLAFVGALAIGWLLGVLSSLLWIARIATDRRRLRAELKSSSGSIPSVRDERS